MTLPINPINIPKFRGAFGQVGPFPAPLPYGPPPPPPLHPLPPPPPPPPILPNNLLSRQGPPGPPGPQGAQGPTGSVENIGGAYSSTQTIAISAGGNANLNIIGTTFQTNTLFDSTGITLPKKGRYNISYNLDVTAVGDSNITTTLSVVSGTITFNSILTDTEVIPNGTTDKLKASGIVDAAAGAKFNINVAVVTGTSATVPSGSITVQLVSSS